MKTYQFILIAFTLVLSTDAYCQGKLRAEDITGTWTASINQSRAKSMDMLLDGSTITLDPDFTFTGNLLGEISGTWKLEESTVHLDSPDTPGPIVLSELSKDSCIWNMDNGKAIIPFFKTITSTPLQSEVLALVHVDKNELTGDWINTTIEHTTLTKKQNDFLFGESKMNEGLHLNKTGVFQMSKSTGRIRTKENSEGSWSVADGILSLQFESGKTERLGISKFTQDSLVLVDLDDRIFPNGKKTKIRFTYTK